MTIAPSIAASGWDLIPLVPELPFWKTYGSFAAFFCPCCYALAALVPNLRRPIVSVLVAICGPHLPNSGIPAAEHLRGFGWFKYVAARRFLYMPPVVDDYHGLVHSMSSRGTWTFSVGSYCSCASMHCCVHATDAVYFAPSTRPILSRMVIMFWLSGVFFSSDDSAATRVEN